ncbi:MAG: S-layer homology domain-containing protein, partial [Acidaminococcaceae bacterium]|nr:S-layer homology domain-containing protein [Acidaminococcaceae bacterium]
DGDKNKLVTAGDIADAINSAAWNVDSATASGKEKKAVKAGDTVKFEAGDNIELTQAGTAFTYALKKDITVDSVTVNNGPVLNSAGINMGGKKITNLAAGTEDGDAVNYSQLKKVSGDVTKLQAGFKLKSGDKETQVELGKDEPPTIEFAADDNLEVALDGKKVTYGLKNVITVGKTGGTDKPVKIDGSKGEVSGLTNTTIDAPDFATKGRAASEEQLKQVNDKVDSINNTVATKGLTFNGDTGTTGVKKLGDQVAVTGDDNITTKATSDGIKITLNKDIAVDSVKINNGGPVIDADGIRFVNPDGGIDTSAPSISKTDGINAGGKKITGVAQGEEGTDAVNVDQLNNKVNTAAAAAKTEVKAGKNITSVDSKQAADGHTIYTVNAKDTVLESGNVTYDANGNGTLTLVNNDGEKTSNVVVGGMKDTVVKGGKTSYDDKGNATITLTNNDGSTSTIEGSKNNYTTGGKLENNTLTFERNDGGTYSVEGVASTKDLENIGNSVNRLDGDIAKVGAHSAALAALHPMDFDPDNKWNVAAGFGNYKNANAASVGAFYRPDETVMFSVGATVGGDRNMFNAGVTLQLDGKNRITRSRTAMAQEIVELRSLVTQMAARMDRLDAAAGVRTEMFPDVPANHWAYEYVDDLMKRGIVEGYPNGLFQGDRSMTRYEFAAMLDRAVRKGFKLDSKLAKEFEPELGRIYVERISGGDDDRNKIERVRVVNEDEKTRDVYGSKIKPVQVNAAK